MEKDFDAFLEKSAIAKNVRLAGRVVLNRDALCVREIAEIEQAGKYRLSAEPICELEVGGQVLAHGEIVDHEGGQAFCVRQIVDERFGEKDDRSQSKEGK